MLQWALTFFVLALIAGLVGLTGLAGAAANIAWILFVAFIVLMIVAAVPTPCAASRPSDVPTIRRLIAIETASRPELVEPQIPVEGVKS